jgi:hypothetical protein
MCSLCAYIRSPGDRKCVGIAESTKNSSLRACRQIPSEHNDQIRAATYWEKKIRHEYLQGGVQPLLGLRSMQVLKRDLHMETIVLGGMDTYIIPTTGGLSYVEMT